MTAKLHPFWKLKKAAYYCPEGEQITNGDFEDGDTGWILNIPKASISTAYAHSPTHSMFTYSDGTGSYQAISDLNVACVQELSFWCICPHGTGSMWIRITYTDGSYTEVYYSHGGSWTQRDVVASLAAGKTINEIRFFSDTDNPTYIDDVSLISAE